MITPRSVCGSTMVTILAAGLLVGCASNTYEKGAKTGTGLQKAADQMEQYKSQSIAALAALDGLLTNSNTNLPPQYKSFDVAVKKLATAQSAVDTKANRMAKSGQEFFAAWDKELAQIHNEEIRARSAERKQKVSQQLEQAKTHYQEIKTAFHPFMADLNDIQRALSIDLTTEGVQTIKGAADKAKDHGQDLNKSIDKLIADFREMGLQLPAAAPAKPSAAQASTDTK